MKSPERMAMDGEIDAEEYLRLSSRRISPLSFLWTPEQRQKKSKQMREWNAMHPAKDKVNW